jgi:hypothetical protein
LIQPEHTLVLSGGRSSEGAIQGTVGSINGGRGENYLVRLAGGAERIAQADQIIEYSIPNIINVETSEAKSLYLGKVHYIAPLLSSTMLNPSPNNRDKTHVFTFMSKLGEHDRRKKIIDDYQKSGVLEISNITGVRGDASKVMSGVGILLNLHQTDHHHTLEEFRILPALLQGVMVISEPSPLLEKVPYSSFVNFAELRDIPTLLVDMLANFDARWDANFNHPSFAGMVEEVQAHNKNTFKRIAENLKK